MFKRLFSAALVLGAAALAPPVLAQSTTTCMPRSVLTQQLTQKYNESLTGGGLQNPQQLLEIWSSPETGSFTVFITRANGLSCVVATGQNWQSNVVAALEGVAG
jgi:hypothetical protein